MTSPEVTQRECYSGKRYGAEDSSSRKIVSWTITPHNGREKGGLGDVCLRARSQVKPAPWTELSGRVLHVDDLEEDIRLSISMEKRVEISLPKGEIIQKPSLIAAGSIISILRTNSGYYVKTSFNTSPQNVHTKVDIG